MEWIVDSFGGYVHKAFVIVYAKFGEILTWFDPPITKFSKDRGLKNLFLRRAKLFLSPVKPMFKLNIIGSTGV